MSTQICPHGKATEDYGKKFPCPICESVPVVKPVTTPANLWEQYENRHDDYPWRDRNDALLFDKWWTYRIAAPWIVKTEPSARYGVLANAFKTLCEDFQISRPASKPVLAVGMPVRARPTPHPFRARCCRFFFP